jgi:exopolyphosphatase/pppGpp-phosphohydrolase
MQAFRNLMDVYKVTDYMACATSAMREALNGQEVADLIKDRSRYRPADSAWRKRSQNNLRQPRRA